LSADSGRLDEIVVPLGIEPVSLEDPEPADSKPFLVTIFGSVMFFRRLEVLGTFTPPATLGEGVWAVDPGTVGADGGLDCGPEDFCRLLADLVLAAVPSRVI
jgi:hypothetical protein